MKISRAHIISVRFLLLYRYQPLQIKNIYIIAKFNVNSCLILLTGVSQEEVHEKSESDKNHDVELPNDAHPEDNKEDANAGKRNYAKQECTNQCGGVVVYWCIHSTLKAESPGSNPTMAMHFCPSVIHIAALDPGV